MTTTTNVGTAKADTHTQISGPRRSNGIVLAALAIMLVLTNVATGRAQTKPYSRRHNSAHEDPEGWGRMGADVRVSTLGAGGEVAFELTHTTNVRGGFNFFSYNRGYDHNGIHYAGDLRWRSAEAHFDWFPFGHAFHLSPGLMVYNDNRVNAQASVPGGEYFTLNNTSYISDQADPVNGTAKLYFTKVDPTFMLGFGNLVPRNGSHLSINFEVGVAFEGSPKINLNLNGTACAPDGTNCQGVATTPSIQDNVLGEQAKIAHDLEPFKYYPIISLSIGYRF